MSTSNKKKSLILGFDPKIFDPTKKNSSVGFRKAVKAA
jgi:hypothetical protein